jgi:hypothetical protein
MALKNAKIGKKAVSLFIVTDTPAEFEALAKTKFPRPIALKARAT